MSSFSSPPSLLPGGRGRLTLALMFQRLQTKKGIIKGTLHIHIQSARALPNMDERGYTDGFVRMSLLPHRDKQKKTRVISDDLNPVWDQKFTFPGVALEDLKTKRVLELTVWDYDMLCSNDFVGALRLGPSPGDVEGEGKTHDWMDSRAREAKHWKEMLSRCDEWVEYSHLLRPSMDPISHDRGERGTSSGLEGSQEDSHALHRVRQG